MSTIPQSTQSPSQKLRLIASLLVLLSAICFSGKAVLVKLAYRYEMDSVTLLTLRMIFSLPFFLINAWIGKQRHKRGGNYEGLRWRDWLNVIALGLSGYYLASLLDFMGLQYITAGLERLILFLYPTMVLLLSSFFLRKAVTRTQFGALLLTYGGVAMALLDHTQLGGDNVLLGAVLIFGSGFAYAVYMVGSTKYILRLGPMRYTSTAMIAASMAIILHHGIVYQWQLWHYPAEVYWLVLAMAIFATVLPTLLVSEGIRVIGAGNTAIISSIGPVATIIMGYVFLGESFGGWQVPGTLLVMGGVLWISLKKA
ncbi:MAG: DMT family transporter [Saprospiraceae bacterium]|nr:DMT family transporter [Saprospiraceae bacterium]MDZ4706234.1 DMT family transporter [Saprospiraceae bacterium]